MKDRVLSGVTLVAFFMAIVVFNRSFPLALNIAIAFISALAVFEVIKALGLSDRWYITVPGMTAAVLVQFCEFQQANIFIYSVFTACIFCALLRHHREITFKEMAVVYSMVVLIPLALQTIVLVRTLSDQHGMFYALVCVKFVCDSVLRGAGAMRPFMVTTFSDLIIRVVLSIALFYVVGNEHGIWLSWPIGWFLGSGLSVFFYKSGAWKKNLPTF